MFSLYLKNLLLAAVTLGPRMDRQNVNRSRRLDSYPAPEILMLWKSLKICILVFDGNTYLLHFVKIS